MGLRKWHHARLQPTRGADRQCPCEELQRHCATGVLGPHWFLELDDAREKVEEWRTEYNEEDRIAQSVKGRTATSG